MAGSIHPVVCRLLLRSNRLLRLLHLQTCDEGHRLKSAAGNKTIRCAENLHQLSIHVPGLLLYAELNLSHPPAHSPISSLLALNCPSRILLTGTPIQNGKQSCSSSSI